MAVVPRPRLWPHTSLRLDLIEEAKEKVKCSGLVPLTWNATNGNQEVEKSYKEELTEQRAQEKCMFMNSLGLVRKDLVPTIQVVMASRQRKRLRPRKPRPSSPEPPSKTVKSLLPLSNPVHKKPKEEICEEATSLKQKVPMKPKDVQKEVPQPVPKNSCGASKASLEVEKACRDEGAQGKCMFLNAFGLERTNIVPVVQESMDSRKQSSRLRPRKPQVPSPELPSKEERSALPTGNPGLHKKPEEVIQEDAADLEKKVSTKPKDVQRRVSQSDRSTRSKGVKRPAATPSAAPPSKRRAKSSADTVQVGPAEPADTLPCNPAPLDRVKRQRRRPSKLLDSDFVFDFLQPVGGATSEVTATECNMDTRSPRSVSPA